MTISMTGFGRATAENELIKVKIEMKSVNSRYHDCNMKIPKAYAFVEEKLKKLIKQQISRGKIDVYVTIKYIDNSNVSISIDMDLANQYFLGIQKVKDSFLIKKEIEAFQITSIPGVFVTDEEEIDEELILQFLENTCQEALNNILVMKKNEGKHIYLDMQGKISELVKLISEIEKLSESVVDDYREKLKNRIEELLNDQDIDENRLSQEVAYFADKACIDEELIRLSSHVKQFNDNMAKDQTGRKLDFIIQEMNREINTIGSKGNSLEITNLVLECKSIVEKLREQAMNLE
ncbi:MAG: YicC family protein [Clostridiales bacterium]|nr:YicC family protein [Clostridiales bacterium]